MDLGLLLESPQGSHLRLQCGHARALFSRALGAESIFRWVDQGVSCFPSRLSHEAFPRGFPTGLSHVPPSCESVLRVNVEAVKGKQVPLERTETSGGLLEWWNDPGVPLTFLVERASS